MRVIGKVVDDSGKPLAGLQVRAFDKDLVFDDKLGTTTTNAAGEFRIDYTEAQYTMVADDPDLYIRIFDTTGQKLLFTSEKAIRRSKNVEEHYDVTIPAAKLR